MKLRRLQLVLPALLLWCGTFALGQTAAQKSKTTPFEPGELLVYKAEVSRSLLKKIDVATLSLVADRVPANKSATGTTGSNGGYSFVFTGDAQHDRFFTPLFKLKFRQHVESTVDPESMSVQRTVK